MDATRYARRLQQPLTWIGRALLGLYFVVPGITKITGFTAMSDYMAAQGVPLIPVALSATILIQIGAGSSLILGWRPQVMALMLAGLTLVINLFMHDFWNFEDAARQAHETQNFVKNLAIMAGLLCIAGMPVRASATSR